MPNSSPTTSADLPLWSQFWTASRLKVSSNFRRSGTDVCFMNLSFHCSPDSLSVKSRYPQLSQILPTGRAPDYRAIDYIRGVLNEVSFQMWSLRFWTLLALKPDKHLSSGITIYGKGADADIFGMQKVATGNSRRDNQLVLYAKEAMVVGALLA